MSQHYVITSKETVPDNQDDDLEALAITIQPDVFPLFYDPLCFGIKKAQAPGWCKHVIALLKQVTFYKEWMHILKTVIVESMNKCGVESNSYNNMKCLTCINDDIVKNS
jgi:hypothetical protein